jgi:hypothetical protein
MILLAAMWSGYWFIMSSKYYDKIYLWIDTESNNVSAKFTKIKGFPNRFDTTIKDLKIKQKSSDPIKIDRLDVMRLSYDNSHYIFAINSIQNIFENNFIFSKGLASAVSKNGIAPTINFEGKDVSVNDKLLLNELNFMLWPTTNLSKFNFSFTSKIAATDGINFDLSFKGKIDFYSSIKINNLTSLVSNINSLQKISGTLYVQDTEGLNTVLERDPNGWKIIVKSDAPEKIPNFIKNLDIVTIDGI